MKVTLIRFCTTILFASVLSVGPAYADIIVAENPDAVIKKYPEHGDDLFALSLGEGDLSESEYGDGTLLFENKYGDPLTDSGDPTWWAGTGSVFTTTTDTMVVTFEDLFVTGFTFRIGANMSARAWIHAFYTDSAGQNGDLYSDWFSGIGHGVSPEYGVFLKDSDGCGRIDRIVIDPHYFVWGIGDMAISTNDSCSVSVPEPGSLGLLGAGLLAMGLVWRTRRRATIPV